MNQRKIGSMRVPTERDLEILKFINLFGMCEIDHLNKRFQFNETSGRNYKVMRRLVKNEWVYHQKIITKNGVYWLTRKGASYTHLPPIKKIPDRIYSHEVTLIDLYLHLMNRYPHSAWVSERELIHDKYFDGLGMKGHVADGLLILADDKKIAVELELTSKSKNRVEEIFRQYAMQSEIKEVWYFCSNEVAHTLKKNELLNTFTFIKILKLEEFDLAKS